ncbi:MAG TPA: hypothetical protein VL326_18395 [Kofleriaceae bacterium]|jgi:hypothetical protein|nr:hypothetical protein [Kofleriaceae bacterium]
MKWIACLVALAACQSGNGEHASPSQGAVGKATGSSTVISLPKAELTDAYRADITNLCDAMQQSGALDHPADERWQVIAMWLGPHITTDAGHEFLVAIQPLQGEPKALALETEAKRVGLAKCDLANEWRK